MLPGVLFGARRAGTDCGASWTKTLPNPTRFSRVFGSGVIHVQNHGQIHFDLVVFLVVGSWRVAFAAAAHHTPLPFTRPFFGKSGNEMVMAAFITISLPRAGDFGRVDGSGSRHRLPEPANQCTSKATTQPFMPPASAPARKSPHKKAARLVMNRAALFCI